MPIPQFFTGLVDRTKDLLVSRPGSFPRRTLRVAEPGSNAFQFYAINSTCLHQHCGLDIYLVEYLAFKLNKTLE